MSAFANTIAEWAPFLAAWMATTLIVSAVLTGVALLLHRLARGVVQPGDLIPLPTAA